MPTLPPRHVIPLPGGGTMAFRLVEPKGPFRMGSRGYRDWEEPIHEVALKEEYWMGETPVTQGQFEAWTKAEGIEHENLFKGRPDHPAENLDWWQAVGYCAWLTAKVERNVLPPGFGWFCLPTEAEWEYACRAGTQTEYCTGNGEAALAEAGWFDEDWDTGSAHPVGRKKANGFGLFDVHGNVLEWCQDIWEESAYRSRMDGAMDPGWAKREQEWRDGLEVMLQSNQLRVVRGGSWDFSAGYCRSAFRAGIAPVVRYGNGGFRVCLVRGPVPSQPGAEAPRGTGGGGGGTTPQPDGPGGDGADRPPAFLGGTP